MKKILLIMIISLSFISTANATTVEEQLAELKTALGTLQNQVNDLESARLNKTYPIGSIYISTAYSTASQVASAIGGTWEVYGSGRTLVGVNASDTSFNTVGKTGGASTTALTVANLPNHSHSIPTLAGTATSAGAHAHSIPALTGMAASAGDHTHSLSTWVFNSTNHAGGINRYGVGWKSSGENETRTGVNTSLESTWGIYNAGAHTHTVKTNASTSGSSGAHTHSVTTNASTSGSLGSGVAFTNLQPYITVYMYRRMA